MSSETQSKHRGRPKIAVFKFASCDGCQLSLLDAEDDLLGIVGAVEIAYFPEASRTMLKGPYDIGLVEGSITTHQDAQRIQEVRRSCKTLVTIGACATAGGIQALRNWKDVNDFIRVVYATPQYINTLKLSTPIAEHVPVDFELRGCPINKRQLVELITATLAGRKPNVPTYSVCIECKRKGNVCIAVAQRRCLFRPGDAGRLWRVMPELRPWLLRVLWADGKSEHGFAIESVPHSRAIFRTSRTRLPGIQCLVMAVSPSQRGE